MQADHFFSCDYIGILHQSHVHVIAELMRMSLIHLYWLCLNYIVKCGLNFLN